MNELENNIKDRVKLQSHKTGRTNERRNIPEVKFNIDIQNIDIFNFLSDYYKRINRTWMFYYEFAKKYYDFYGNLEVPQKFKTNDGITYDQNGKINLGKWISNQRYKCQFESERGKLLSQIGMRFESDNFTLLWNEMYKYAKKYYESHGDLEVPLRFKTNDGVTYNPNGKINLGQWIVNQRSRCLPESERGKLLSQIGMRFESKNLTLLWNEMYKYAKKYYETHRDLEMSARFKTNDGMIANSDGKINLGPWVAKQRQICPFESKRGKLLLQIGMRFNTLKDNNSIKSICLKNGIDLELNKQVVQVSTLEEFIAKIKLSEELGINLIDENGKLNQIFYMNDEEFKDKFGYSVEDLINKYSLKSLLSSKSKLK